MGRMPILLAAAAAALGCSSPAWAADECDRACMAAGLGRYLTALIAHDPKAAPIAASMRSTENGHEVKPGEGLWRTVTGLGGLQRRYYDPVSQQAAYYGVMMEGAEPALVSLRVRFSGAAISESEAIVAREGELLYNPAGAVETPPPPVPPGAEPTQREAMQATVAAYFDALQGGDPAAVPKIDGCERVENGTNVVRRRPGRAAPAGGAAADEEVHGDCTTGLNTMPISAVAHRRYPVLDTEAGVALGVGLFQRPPGATWRDGSPRKRNLIHEYFAQDGGKIALIWAVMHYREPEDPDGTGW